MRLTPARLSTYCSGLLEALPSPGWCPCRCRCRCRGSSCPRLQPPASAGPSRGCPSAGLLPPSPAFGGVRREPGARVRWPRLFLQTLLSRERKGSKRAEAGSERLHASLRLAGAVFVSGVNPSRHPCLDPCRRGCSGAGVGCSTELKLLANRTSYTFLLCEILWDFHKPFGTEDKINEEENMLATENRIQRRARFCQVALLSPAKLSPPACCEKAGNWVWGELVGGACVPRCAQENFPITVLQVKPCNFIILK